MLIVEGTSFVPSSSARSLSNALRAQRECNCVSAARARHDANSIRMFFSATVESWHQVAYASFELRFTCCLRAAQCCLLPTKHTQKHITQTHITQCTCTNVIAPNVAARVSRPRRVSATVVALHHANVRSSAACTGQPPNYKNIVYASCTRRDEATAPRFSFFCHTSPQNRTLRDAAAAAVAAAAATHAHPHKQSPVSITHSAKEST